MLILLAIGRIHPGFHRVKNWKTQIIVWVVICSLCALQVCSSLCVTSLQETLHLDMYLYSKQTMCAHRCYACVEKTFVVRHSSPWAFVLYLPKLEFSRDGQQYSRANRDVIFVLSVITSCQILFLSLSQEAHYQETAFQTLFQFHLSCTRTDTNSLLKLKIMYFHD